MKSQGFSSIRARAITKETWVYLLWWMWLCSALCRCVGSFLSLILTSHHIFLANCQFSLPARLFCRNHVHMYFANCNLHMDEFNCKCVLDVDVPNLVVLSVCSSIDSADVFQFFILVCFFLKRSLIGGIYLRNYLETIIILSFFQVPCILQC